MGFDEDRTCEICHQGRESVITFGTTMSGYKARMCGRCYERYGSDVCVRPTKQQEIADSRGSDIRSPA